MCHERCKIFFVLSFCSLFDMELHGKLETKDQRRDDNR
jgi:hypothetical protein